MSEEKANKLVDALHVTLEPCRPTYKVIANNGRVLGTFEQVSEWEGILKLKKRNGTMTLIVNQPDSAQFQNLMSSFFCDPEDREPMRCSVVKAAPSLIMDMTEEPDKEKK